MDLSKIKATIVLPKNSRDQSVEQFELLYHPSAWSGSTSRVAWSWIIANPVLAIKKDVRLAKKTNATQEQIDFIELTPQPELEKLLKSDGKKVSGRRGNGGKAVSGNDKD